MEGHRNLPEGRLKLAICVERRAAAEVEKRDAASKKACKADCQISTCGDSDFRRLQISRVKVLVRRSFWLCSM